MTATTQNRLEEDWVTWVTDPMIEVHWDELAAQGINPRPEYPTFQLPASAQRDEGGRA